MTLNSIIIFLIILFTLVVIHELGHFLLAKFFKMRVDEFAFGFPPNLFRKKIGETTYSLNLIPLGGYVKIFGENGLEQEEINKLHANDKKRLFGSNPWWQRIIVLSAGVLFNVLGAVFLFTFAFMLGPNILDRNQVENIPYSSRNLILADLNDKSPLQGTGIEIDDKILQLKADQVILSGPELNSYSAADFIQAHNNSSIEITYVTKSNEQKILNVSPKAGIVEGKKIIGAKFIDSSNLKKSFFESLNQAIDVTYNQLIYIFASIWNLLNSLIFNNAKVEDSISGPVGLAVMTTRVAKEGLDQIFAFAAMLSLSLAVFNILPIPALDGGRIVFVLIEFVTRKKIKADYEQIFHGLGFLALLSLMVFVTYFDIVKAISS